MSPQPTRRPPEAVGTELGAAATLLGSLAFISTVVSKDGLSSREAFLLPVGIAGCVVATVGLVLLLTWLPRFLHDLPGWVVGSVGAALAFTLVLTWFDATGVVAIASETDDATFDRIGSAAGTVALMAPKSLASLVGFGALAVTGLRAGLLGRGPAVLIGLGALASVLPPFPPGLVLVSLGLLVAVRRVPARTDSVVRESVSGEPVG